MKQEERLDYLINALLDERGEGGAPLPRSITDRKRLLRALFNVRMPGEIGKEFLRIQDDYLAEELRQKGVTSIDDLTPVEDGIYLWQGDITTLKCGAIINAANSQLLGCFYPCHGCIDNAIHTFAGVQLRSACSELIKAQCHEEDTGKAKLTPAFNLPCRYVIHTVGPIVGYRLTDEDCRLLESCYASCLELAEENAIESVAFCCISTGEFHFPNDKAAEIAVRTVRRFRKGGGKVKVIFNVFKDIDLEIYHSLLESGL